LLIAGISEVALYAAFKGSDDARGARFSELLQFTDSSRLDGVETLVVINKGLGIGESSDYASFRVE